MDIWCVSREDNVNYERLIYTKYSFSALCSIIQYF